jgi:hypothetical protein
MNNRLRFDSLSPYDAALAGKRPVYHRVIGCNWRTLVQSNHEWLGSKQLCYNSTTRAGLNHLSGKTNESLSKVQVLQLEIRMIYATCPLWVVWLMVDQCVYTASAMSSILSPPTCWDGLLSFIVISSNLISTGGYHSSMVEQAAS